MDALMEKLKESPDDKKIFISYAEAIVKFHQNNGKGNLQAARSIFKKMEINNSLSLYCRDNL